VNKISTELVRPFAGLRPTQGRAHEIAAPPYDIVTSEEARLLAGNKPYSFLHISHAEIDLPPSTDPHDDVVYAKARENIQMLHQRGLLVRDTSPSFYVYRMTRGPHIQTGVVVSASIDAYLDNRIRKHELTRPQKENDRVRQIESVDAQTGPVLLVYRTDRRLAQVLAESSEHEADASVPKLFGVKHEIWVVSDQKRIAHIASQINQMEFLYIADGHHRSAAAARVAERRRQKDADHNENHPYRGFLAVAFAEDEVTILSYNRIVVGLNGQKPEQFINLLSQDFVITPCSSPVTPQERYSFGMYLNDQWFSLTPNAPLTTTDPIDQLDVSVLDRLIIKPLLGISDPRTDPRIEFVGGTLGPNELAKRVNSADEAVGFTLFPTTLGDLIKVADAGKVMPPKSTWFDPKLADGLVSLPL
tara:strand:+ start:719 stop:1969 length:1251 start_codon:yes stop_codon:yes gene_type:complete